MTNHSKLGDRLKTDANRRVSSICPEGREPARIQDCHVKTLESCRGHTVCTNEHFSGQAAKKEIPWRGHENLAKPTHDVRTTPSSPKRPTSSPRRSGSVRSLWSASARRLERERMRREVVGLRGVRYGFLVVWARGSRHLFSSCTVIKLDCRTG